MSDPANVPIIIAVALVLLWGIVRDYIMDREFTKVKVRLTDLEAEHGSVAGMHKLGDDYP